MGNPKILALANKIGQKKPGSKAAYKYGDPEYMILEPVVTDEMADVAMFLEFRQPKSVKEVSELCGKSIEDTERILYQIGMDGVCLYARQMVWINSG